ncbi:hypothetical protein CB0940_05667 [Cercospora beticola]|uniref:Major facilitator superfamily (MFS) profile domain-containing protein n=1 Tax=Cercospora beticola TaxID=122368 RepID=A0A2G5I044_CERBT|nr:hypothetical protein CB0940_05667 [Cercospora beticola]PIA98177.1 hypothetical protein CB0940_05667 [Cercospora beticola]WPA98238.1 hypothetical protein RHO25_002850 [Cercospora beticola]CAK1359465.1 unnamed protein product [Cercospora beticola]
MSGELSPPGDQRRGSYESQSSSKKSSPDASRSQSQVRENSEWLTQPGRQVSIDDRSGTSTHRKESTSHHHSAARLPNGRTIEIETPRGPIRRETFHSLAAMSGRNNSDDVADKEEPTWPTDWKAYVCLLAGFCLMFNSWGLVNAYGTYASFYMNFLMTGKDLLYFNLIGGTQSAVVLGLSGIVGRFLDAGFTRELIALGTVLVSVGTLTLGFVNGDGGENQGNFALTWLTQGFISGLGMACFFVSSSQVVATWFKKKKGFAIGIVASGASIAGLVYPMMTKFLIDSSGFNAAARWVSLVVFLTSCLAFACANPNPKHIIRKPDDWMRWDVFVDSHAFRNKSYASFVAAIAFLFLGFYAIFFNLEEWAFSNGIGFRRSTGAVGLNAGLPEKPADGKIETFWLLAIMNACSTIGRLSSSYFCDRIGALNVHCIVTLVSSLLTLILWTLASGFPSALAFVIFFGAFSGAVIGLPPASVAYILGPTPEAQAKLGQWTGMMYTCAAIPALIGPVIAGHMITEYSTYLTVQMWAGVCLLLSAGCMGLAIYFRQTMKRPEGPKGPKDPGNTPPNTRQLSQVTDSSYDLEKNESKERV